MKIKQHYDVIIIGAGPCGVIAANMLGRSEVETLIIDKSADIHMQPRAIGMCEEGCRVMDAAGLLSDYMQQMIEIPQVIFNDKNNDMLFCADMSELSNGYSGLYTFYQPALERHMRAALTQHHSVDLASNAECLQVEDFPDSVRVRLSTPEGVINVSCRYLVASDGARSVVRKSFGIGFKGKTYAQDWLIVDVKKDPLPRADVAFLCDPRRPGVTLPAPGGRRRWEFVIKSSDSATRMHSDEKVAQLLQPWGDAKSMVVERKAIYRFHSRIAKQFRRGNVFLLGDAAHLTPPFAGQGMMAGFRDAHNLSWKLSAVLKGQLDEIILDSYERERLPQARQVIRFAEFVGYIILPQKKWLAAGRDWLIRSTRMLGLQSPDKSITLRKIVNHINGSLANHLTQCLGRPLGIQFPQWPLKDNEGQRRLSDSFLSEQFYLLGFGCRAEDFLSDSTRQRWRSIAGKTLVINRADPIGLKSVGINSGKVNYIATNSCASGEVIDCDSHYAELFKRGANIIVIRPDKMMVINCDKVLLNKRLNKYLDSIGCQPVHACEEVRDAAAEKDNLEVAYLRGRL